MNSPGAFRRDASEPTRTWRALRSISPRAPATTSSATPSRSMAAWCTRIPGWRFRGSDSDGDSALPRPALAGSRRAKLALEGWGEGLSPRIVTYRQTCTPLTGSHREAIRPLPAGGARLEGDHVSIFTYSKSPGLLSMPTFGGEIQLAYS